CDNAIRYNVSDGKVTIKIINQAGNAEISVSDTGIGIAPEHQVRIFERFYRVDKSHSKETGGTGLGLSIVKHAVQFHKAKVTLDSEMGKGTTVTVKF
ncbi:MAG: PAS domain-containing sensor histidine kinase, partial [Clostridia bacterium]|nr:PAS domain-containing sensor histidine kinase [Clostridia bacterium]